MQDKPTAAFRKSKTDDVLDIDVCLIIQLIRETTLLCNLTRCLLHYMITNDRSDLKAASNHIFFVPAHIKRSAFKLQPMYRVRTWIDAIV